MMLRLTLALIALLPTAALGASAPRWAVDKARSTIAFSATMNGEGFNGRFLRWDARIHFDPAALQSSSVVAVISTASVRTGDATRDEALPTEDWFAAKVFPQAIFRSNLFRHLSGNRYQAVGTLAIRGRTQPVTLAFTLVITGKRAVMRGHVTIDRRNFGVGQRHFASPDSVAAAVRVAITIVATRAG